MVSENANFLAEPPAIVDVEKNSKTFSYPKTVGIIIIHEFCERFYIYGMRSILVLYLTLNLDYDVDSATVFYHIWTTLVYGMSLVGAILSDSWLGKFKTTFHMSIVNAVGGVVIVLGAVPYLNLPVVAITFLGLALVAIGFGGMRPCITALGGDQFKLPEQNMEMVAFFSVLYCMSNLAALIATPLTPILREDVKCFGEDSCFAVAFGVPGILMCLSLVLFIGFKNSYIVIPPTGNVMVLVSKCISNAIATRWREYKVNKKDHWLEYAEPKYGKQLVHDTKILLKILVLFIPLPIFWALYDQKGTRWTFQATRMDGNIGIYTVKPDQMQVIIPLLVLILIPVFDMLVYPLLSKVGIRRPLQKIAIGGILAGVSFIFAGLVELQLEGAQITNQKPISMMWLLPQYIVMSIAEIMLSVTGMSFSYSQAPVSMKTVLQASWLFTSAFGNVIDAVIVGLKIFELQSNESFLFAGLMFINMFVFIILAYKYKPLDIELMKGEPHVDKIYTKSFGIDNIGFKREKDHRTMGDNN